jgi:hypothetical protein
MAMSGTTLKAALKAAILSQLQALFPVSGSLTADEQTALNAAQSKIAEAIAYGDGPTTVSHITANAAVATTDTGTVTTGLGAGGVVAATGIGTVS